MDINVKLCRLANIDYLIVDVPAYILTELQAHADTVQQDWSKNLPLNQHLPGHINHEYAVEPNNVNLDKFVLQVAYKYNEQYNIFSNNKIFSHGLDAMAGPAWMNFQAATEYNPPHTHSGLISWTVWLKIPYTRVTEQTIFPNRPDCLNGAFQFLYPSVSGDIATETIFLDSSYEGKMIMFPSNLMHTVYPFYTSPDYKISVSGNVFLDTEKLGGNSILLGK
jgi:hypothetical protein